MLSIFDEDRVGEKTNGKLPVDRLRERLSHQYDATSAAPASVDYHELGSTSAEQQGGSVVRDGSAAKTVSQPPSMPIMSPVHRTDTAVSPEFQRFSEQFTRSFLEAVGRAVSDIHALVVEERGRSQTALDTFSKASRELEALNSRVMTLSQRFDSLASAQQEASLRLDRAEAALSVVSGANGTLQELRQSFSTRLDAQADAIRTLHGAVEEREGHLEKLLAVLHSLKDVAGGVPASEKSLASL